MVSVRLVVCTATISGLTLIGSTLVADENDSNRVTPLVQAVAKIRPSVVNIRGKKTVQQTSVAGTNAQRTKQVNGMGTGVIIDSRGYVLTNHHVVENVKRIEVTLFDGSTTTGKLIAVDNDSDLALLKINTGRQLDVVPLGTSSDLMLAEPVAAIGNAFGYEHTVTRGIISELGRTVQVSNDQIYYNQIQTDAAINPGNSGGPLLNMDGEMIGINVAVRVGAQGIAFAIPVNDAIEIAARMFEKLESDVELGFSVRTVYKNNTPSVQVESVDPDSAAGKAGLRPGDRIALINSTPCHRRLDLQRAVFDRRAGDVISLQLDRDSTPMRFALTGTKESGRVESAWERLGVRLRETYIHGLDPIHADYKHGLKVESVRKNSPAHRQGIKPGDIIVAMDGWKTETLDNVTFVLQQSEIQSGKTFEFFIFRGRESLRGQLRVAQLQR